MKKALLVFLFFSSFLSYATTYYISPTGNDVSGTGSISNPWKTLYKATNTVSTLGDIIHVNAGTYIETAQSNLSIGVSIEGDSPTLSIIKSSLTADWTAILVANSPEGTIGNQHISNLKFDGQNLATFWGILISGRSNVSIHDIVMVDFKNRGVILRGRNDNLNMAPSIYATGNTFYNNVLTNNAEYDQILNYGAGNLCIGGQEDLLIYNNTISQLSRPAGFNGWCIKYENDGYLKNCKLYNNTFHKILNSFYEGDNNWDFAIELFHNFSLEIYNNIFDGGGIDLNYTSKGSYSYGAWIHNNSITMPTLNMYMQTGITTEFDSEDILIEENKIDKVSVGILFTPRNHSTVKNIVIRKNLITGVGMAESTGFLISMGTYGVDTTYFNNIDIYNNTMVEDPMHPTFFGIKLPNPTKGYVKNIHIKNNIIANAYSAPIVQQGTSIVIDSLEVQYNNIYGTVAGYSGDDPAWISGALMPTHYLYTSNLHVTPLFISSSDFHLQSASPLIDAGVNVGLSYLGTSPDIGCYEYGITTSISELNTGEVIVYPNPCSSSFKLNFITNKLKQVELYDNSGKLVHKESSNAQNVEILINNFDKGIYLLKIKIDANEFVKKIIKE